MSKTNPKDYGFTEEELEALREGALIWTLQAFEEACEKDPFRVWKELSSPVKAHIRRMVAIEQLKVGEL